MKKLFTFLIAICAVVNAFAYNFQSGGLYYIIYSGGNAEVTRKDEIHPYTQSSVTIPQTVTYNGKTYRVTSIGDYAFYGCSGLTSITIPNSVTSIGKEAFYNCSKLTSITIPNSITSIGKEAFYNCSKLTSITIPNSVTTIGDRAFAYCYGLTSVTIGNSVTSIGSCAFEECSGLTSVTIPKSVTSIDSYAFFCCSGLTSIVVEQGNSVYDSRNNCNALIETATNTLIVGCQNTIIPNSVTSIGDHAFRACSGLTSLTIPESVTSIGYDAFMGCSGLKSVTVPNGVTSIESRTFSGCSGLTSVTIPESVTSIEWEAFYGCSGLTSVTIPNSVTSIGEDAFYQVGYVVYIYNGSATGSPWGADARYWKEGHLIYANEARTKLVKCDHDATGEIVIPENVTSIESSAFSDCSGITAIKWNIKHGKDVSTIKDAPFYSIRSQITSFTFGNEVEHIPAYLCYGMSKLTSVTIPNSVTSIGDYAFSGCTGLTSITIPNNVTNIGGCYAFKGCSGLTSITWNAKNCTGPEGSPYYNPFFYGINSQITSFTFGNEVEHIPAYLCCNMSGLTSVTIGNSVTNIGNRAFYGCSGLTSIVWNAKNYIDPEDSSDAPFYGIRSQITSFTFGNEVEHIPAYLCYGMSKLTSVTIPNSVTSIGDWAFYGCSGLTSVTIHNSVTSIGNGAFYDCTDLTSFIIPNGVKSIGDEAFCSCFRLTSLTIPESVTSIGERAFSSCSGLASVTIPNSIMSIEYGTFSHCSGLTSITIPESVTSIGSSAFSGCTGLASITIPNGVTSIGSSAFSGCSGLTSVTIPNGVTSIGESAFDGCAGITSIVWNAKNCADSEYSSYAPFGSISSQITSFTFGNEIEHIPAYLCKDMSKLTSITIPESVTSISSNAFSGCTGLTSITIPESVTSIGSSVFSGCTGLTSITIPESITSIGERDFEGCSRLTTIVWNAKNCADSEYSSYAPFGSISSQVTSFTFGDEIEHIPAYLCKDMLKLTSITIPESVTSIGESAFEGCAGLTSITIPESVTSIGDGAFNGCTGLTSVVWNAINCADPEYLWYAHFHDICSQITSFTFGNEVEHIPASLCEDMSKLTSITIPESVTSIGSSAFDGCTAIMSITIPESVTSIGERGFYNVFHITYGGPATGAKWGAKYMNKCIDGCLMFESNEKTHLIYCHPSITGEIILPNSVANIEQQTFKGCVGLNAITIPENVTTIGKDAFAGCTSLTSITWNAINCAESPFKDLAAQITSFTFGNKVESIPNDLCANMAHINPTIPEGVTRIGERAFAGCTGLVSITIPEGVTTIRDNAFTGCAGLQSIEWNAVDCSASPFTDMAAQITSFTFGDKVEAIPNDLCANMVHINPTIPEGVTHIGERAFSGCTGFTSITIPENITNIGQDAFRATGLASVTIPEDITEIGTNAFADCANLTSVVWNAINCAGAPFAAPVSQITSFTFGDKVQVIPNSLCSNMQNIDPIIPESVMHIGDLAFYNCTSLTALPLNGHIEHIGVAAFYGCTGLTSLAVPETVTTISNSTFEKCANLQTVNIGPGVTTIGEKAFYRCDKMEILHLNSNLTLIGDSAFYGNIRIYEIKCPAVIPPDISEGTFGGVNPLADLYVPTKSVKRYTVHPYWGKFSLVGLEAQYTVSLLCDPVAGSVSGEGTYIDGTEITIAAIPNDKYAFVQWSDGNTTNPRNFLVFEDITLTAMFAPQIETAIIDASSDKYKPAASKIIRNGQVCILRDGKVYDIMGNQIQ